MVGGDPVRQAVITVAEPVENPLLTFWCAATGLDPEADPRGLNDYRRSLFQGRRVRAFDDDRTLDARVEQHLSLFAARDAAIERWAFAVPNQRALDALVKLSPLVEIGAGTGYWASLLSALGADVVAYDRAPGNHPSGFKQEIARHFPVTQGEGAQVIPEHNDRALLLIWPYMDEMAISTLARFSGTTVAYIGEGDGGCTADDAFHEALRDAWQEVESIAIPQWAGIHDDLTIYRRGTR